MAHFTERLNCNIDLSEVESMYFFTALQENLFGKKNHQSQVIILFCLAYQNIWIMAQARAIQSEEADLSRCGFYSCLAALYLERIYDPWLWKRRSVLSSWAALSAPMGSVSVLIASPFFSHIHALEHPIVLYAVAVEVGFRYWVELRNHEMQWVQPGNPVRRQEAYQLQNKLKPTTAVTLESLGGGQEAH